jgi:hypothetical protein
MDEVGHGLDPADLLHGGIDGRRVLNSHEVDGIEGFQQRKPAIPAAVVSVQYGT